MKKQIWLSILGFVITLFLSANLKANEAYPLPEFTQSAPQEWLNSPPLSKKDLLGKVTLVDIWTFDCWNCYRSFPWLHGVEARYKPKGFQIVGIHSPEFEHEKIHANIKAKIKQFKITNPVMVDNDMRYWKSLNNRYWPAYYLVDKKGLVRATFVGETHADSAQAKNIEQVIETLLAEK